MILTSVQQNGCLKHVHFCFPLDFNHTYYPYTFLSLDITLRGGGEWCTTFQSFDFLTDFEQNNFS